MNNCLSDQKSLVDEGDRSKGLTTSLAATLPATSSYPWKTKTAAAVGCGTGLGAGRSKPVLPFGCKHDLQLIELEGVLLLRAVSRHQPVAIQDLGDESLPLFLW